MSGIYNSYHLLNTINKQTKINGDRYATRRIFCISCYLLKSILMHFRHCHIIVFVILLHFLVFFIISNVLFVCLFILLFRPCSVLRVLFLEFLLSPWLPFFISEFWILSNFYFSLLQSFYVSTSHL